jgi:hypothetical protein
MLVMQLLLYFTFNYNQHECYLNNNNPLAIALTKLFVGIMFLRTHFRAATRVPAFILLQRCYTPQFYEFKERTLLSHEER